MNAPKQKAIDFSMVVQTFRGQKVIREGPSRTIWRVFFDKPISKKYPIISFALTSNPIEHKEVAATWVPCPDKKALERGIDPENKDYLDPEEGSFWNDSKATPSFCRQLVSGKATFFVKADNKNNDFWKFLLNSKEMKGVYTLKQEDNSDLWTWKKSMGPGKEKG